jgi:hypothetical protein
MVKDGGAIYALECHHIVIQECVFLLNGARWGGAVYLERCSDARLVNNFFVMNAAVRDGGAISLSGCSRTRIASNRFWLNVAGRSSPAIDDHASVNTVVTPLR